LDDLFVGFAQIVLDELGGVQMRFSIIIRNIYDRGSSASVGDLDRLRSLLVYLIPV
jgi:hypothetical protein